MTWREYILALRGFNTRRSHDFEHTRFIVYTLHSIYRDPNKSFPGMEEFWPLPTDDLEQREKEKEDEGKRLYEKLQRFKQMYQNKP